MTTTLKTTLTLIRHAQVPANLRHILESRIPGPSLTEHGQRQAAELVERLRERPLDGIAVSTMIRTAETARPLAEARGLAPLVLGGLREVSVGDLQGREDDAARATFWDIVHAWPDGDEGLRVPGGETGVEFYARFDAAIRACLQRGWRQPLLVSHQAAIQAWVRRQSGLTRQWMREYSLPNLGLVELVGDPDTGWELTDWCGVERGA